MKIKTIIARDMRNALRQIGETLGPDAIILSTRQTEDGVEVSAAIEPDSGQPEPAQSSPVTAAPAVVLDESLPGSAFAELLAKTSANAISAAAQPDPAIHEELRTMRHLLEWQLAQLAWNDLTRRSPVLAELLKRLTQMGISSQLSTELLRELPAGLTTEDAQRRALAHLARRIEVTGDRLLDHGGRVAFVGPTGVGKTTGIAKLAARWVMRHGPRDIALVSLDDQRFGAHEQLRVLGRLLGVECFTLEDPAALPQLLSRLPMHRLVLIDTAGLSPRAADLEQRAAALAAASAETGLAVWLTLSAGAQSGVLEEALQRFAQFKPQSLMLTKLDEAASLGGALSALAATGLPLAYVSEGPRIPEDLAPARGHHLVARAVMLAQTHDAAAGDELLARKFGGVAHVIR